MTGPEHSTNNILITGPPGVGKTTTIVRLAEYFAPLSPVGFVTREIRREGRRLGFELLSLDGTVRRPLARVDLRSPCRVGKYGVDVAGFEEFLQQIDFAGPVGRPVLIDEIGRMECFSASFRALVENLLSSPAMLIATIALKGQGFISRVKARGDVTLHEISKANRDRFADRLWAELRRPDSP